MRIATYNVNGVNGRLANLLGWLHEAAPDIGCLQELKAPDDKFPAAALRPITLAPYLPTVDRASRHGFRRSRSPEIRTRWSDEDIAASLNRMGMPTGQGKTWTAHRVSSVRRVNGIHAYRSAEKNGEWLTMSEAAGMLGVTHHRIRRLIKEDILPAEQVVPGAPYQIRTADLQHERVAAATSQEVRG